MGAAKTPETPKTAPSMNEMQLAQNARDQNNLYMQLYAPAEQKVLDDLRATQPRVDRLQGQVSTDLSSQFAPVSAQVNRESAMSGDLSGGRGAVALADVYNGLKSARAGGRAQTDLAANQQETTGLQKMVAFGRNLADANTVGMEKQAQTVSASQLSAMQTALQNRSTSIAQNQVGQNAIGQLAGGLSGLAVGLKQGWFDGKILGSKGKEG